MTYSELCALKKGDRVRLSYRHATSGKSETAKARVAAVNPSVGITVTADQQVMCSHTLLIQTNGERLRMCPCPAGTPSWDVSVAKTEAAVGGSTVDEGGAA